MMAIITWTNIVIGIMLIYAFCYLKSEKKKTFSNKFKTVLVVVSAAGLFLTYGMNIIYLLISGVVVAVALAKDKQKGNDSVKMDS